MIDRNTLKRVFLPVSLVLAPAMLALSFAQGWLVLPLAGAVAASIFGQVTVNETMAARYISPALRARIYSVRFFVGFLGAAAAAPVVAVLYERTGSVAAVTLVLAGVLRRDPGLRAVLPEPPGGTAAGAVGARPCRPRRNSDVSLPTARRQRHLPNRDRAADATSAA